MSANLYLVFDRVNEEASLCKLASTLTIPGFSFTDVCFKDSIEVPGGQSFRVRCSFYAQNYFRIFISDLAVQFYRETTLPTNLVDAERQLRVAFLTHPLFKLRRWVGTSENWNDNDQLVIQILCEGQNQQALEEATGAFNC